MADGGGVRGGVGVEFGLRGVDVGVGDEVEDDLLALFEEVVVVAWGFEFGFAAVEAGL